MRSPDLDLDALIAHLAAPTAAADTAKGAVLPPMPVQGTARFVALSGTAATVAHTLRGALAGGPVSVSGAALSGINLGLAATPGGAVGAGGTTRLTDLEFEVLGSADGLVIRNIAGRAGGLRVQGGLTIDSELRLRGLLRSEVATPRGVSGADIRLGGTVAAPTYQ